MSDKGVVVLGRVVKEEKGGQPSEGYVSKDSHEQEVASVAMCLQLQGSSWFFTALFLGGRINLLPSDVKRGVASYVGKQGEKERDFENWILINLAK